MRYPNRTERERQLSTHNRTLGSDRETLINERAALEGELTKAACQQTTQKLPFRHSPN